MPAPENPSAAGSAPQDVRPPVPPFTESSARAKVQAAEDAWNSRDPRRVALAYTPDTRWRNRDLFLTGRDEVIAFSAGEMATGTGLRPA